MIVVVHSCHVALPDPSSLPIPSLRSTAVTSTYLACDLNFVVSVRTTFLSPFLHCSNLSLYHEDESARTVPVPICSK